MCQAYEAERNFIIAGENWETRKGWIAHRDGKPITANPNYSGYYKEAWDHGWRCREEGIIPWAIEKLHREKVEKETGSYWNDRTPTKEQADALV